MLCPSLEADTVAQYRRLVCNRVRPTIVTVIVPTTVRALHVDGGATPNGQRGGVADGSTSWRMTSMPNPVNPRMHKPAVTRVSCCANTLMQPARYRQPRPSSRRSKTQLDVLASVSSKGDGADQFWGVWFKWPRVVERLGVFACRMGRRNGQVVRNSLSVNKRHQMRQAKTSRIFFSAFVPTILSSSLGKPVKPAKAS